MVRNAYSEVDNRNAEHMFEYMEARIEFMKRRILELQTENETLRSREPAAFRAAGLDGIMDGGIMDRRNGALRLAASRS